MAKKQFKTESKRILDLMINSIYTHKEIFLRELLSNASDAVDKLAYKALTDDGVGLNRSDFRIDLVIDKEARTLTVRDNGVGMTKEELESNLGVIARSGSLQFKQEMEEAGDTDIIGQFGVGFYSAFMVADQVTVITKAYGSDTAYRWESSGADGYTIEETEKDTVGTDIILHIKKDGEEEQFGQYLDQRRIQRLVKKYSDYIRYPIIMDLEQERMKERPEDAGEDYKPEWETVIESTTLNSMVPLWQRKKKDVTEEEYTQFYQDKFSDYEAPLATVSVDAEGTVSYKALLFIPGRTPYDFYTREYEKGLQLYSSGVLIMDKCADLLPEHFRFVKGVVDTPDVSLNISRELLQHTRQLKVISSNLEKKIKAELSRLQKDDTEKYRQFWTAFGRNIKYGLVSDYGVHKDMLMDLVIFPTSHGDEPTSLAQYKERMQEEQEFIYYAVGEDANKLSKLPQAERILDKGYEILYLTEDVDEFCVQTIGEYEGKKLKSINDEDALPETEEEKKAAEEQTEENRDVLSFLKETLGDKIADARISRILKSHAVCMTADGPVSLEMEKYFKRNGGETMPGMTAQRVLELNSEAPAFNALKRAVAEDRELAAKYAELLYCQALLIADLPLEDPAGYADLVCGLMK
ncbi:MAG: molecular chaperone HtpG [Oscillospiraceae bacterium]|jgi:molecular chaperone HtpG|nr:molecular chaperone HtpG [Oscillospiraceae bacterium]MCI9587173.1 molecular chaperone HtpG [Oscillospiraceae bacterium]